ncbi:hypothetical protein I4U23_029370 [Adineta vaga]|nr:hypothetical protein I4U23_029370 [Adineta vaga]
MVLTKRTCNLPLICQICGDRARGINFDVMTCMSCKAFFRRHALQPNHLQCQLENNCEITQITRSGCSACRLKKCFSTGMNSSLIRYIPQKHHQIQKRKTLSLPTLKPLNLLQNDSSTLTTFEWNLLSNIVHAYDQGNTIEYSTLLLQQQSILPPKLRSKHSTTLQIVGFFYSAFKTFIESVPYFRNLPSETHRLLIEQNSNLTGAFNAVFLIRESKALDYPAYVVGSSEVYGHENTDILSKFVTEMEQNVVVLKLMLLLIGFSENCSVVGLHNFTNTSSAIDLSILLRIQNTIVTMLWKYLNYQYGFREAVKCFSSYIYYILNMLRWMRHGSGAQHDEMLETLIINVDQSLKING